MGSLSEEVRTEVLCGHICDLEAENAKLRVERDEWHRVAASKQDIIDHMRNANSENAKLRELCVKALEWLRWAGGITCPPEVPDEFADELRELGVDG